MLENLVILHVKISATYYTGTTSIFIHPTEAVHGDMGMINKKDIVLLISNSGETDEIINIIPSLKRHAKKIASLQVIINPRFQDLQILRFKLNQKKKPVH